MAFKDNLRRLRIEKGFNSRRSFAINTLGIEYTTYNGYEVRGTLPPEDLIIKIAKVLNVSIDDLFGYDAKTQETDLDLAIRELNNLGIKTVIDDNRQEVGIYLDGRNKFTGISFDKAIEMVKTAKNYYLINKGSRHIIYSLIMDEIIRYASPKPNENKENTGTEIGFFSLTGTNGLLDTVSSMKPYSKEEKDKIKHSFKNT